jgi:hypothetical protein
MTVLSDPKATQAKPKEKTYRLSDERGLYLEIQKTGAKYWRMKYRYGGKEKRASFGVYPEVSLKEARVKRDEARKMLAAGVDPSESKRAFKMAKSAAGGNSFEVVALEWYNKQLHTWHPAPPKSAWHSLKMTLFPI